MPFIEDLTEFTDRMDCERLWVSGRWLFRNGGQSDGRLHSDPPADPAQLISLQYEFAVAKASKLKEQYRRHAGQIAEQSRFHSLDAGPPPLQGWQDFLRRLAAKIERCEARAAQLREELPSTKRETGYAEFRAEQKQRAAQVQHELSQLPTFE